MSRLAFDPLLPWPFVIGLAALAVAVAGLALARGLRGWAWRGAAGLAAALALAGPALEAGVRLGLNDIVILLDDRSASQALPGRAAQTDAAVAAMTQRMDALPGTELRRVTVGDDTEGGTRLATALSRALAAEPEARLAGVIAVTDGLIHDQAALPAAAPAPVHFLLTGGDDDWDRRLVIDEAPGFGLIGEPVTLRIRVEDQGAVPPQVAARPTTLSVSVDGGEPMVAAIPPGLTFDLPVVPTHAGPNVVALAIEPPPTPAGAAPQLTDRNDRAAVTITGVRDRLRVLLVSGEPHAGERTWRNLLKSDAAVDLIHFTILRPPDKSDGVPVDELSLIAFPTHELFLERIDDFDLIIFDRYRERGILPPEYFNAIRNYVEKGGAILVAAGPEEASVEGLSRTALREILPAEPTGLVIEKPFTPRLTEDGRRHPVTAGLPGADRGRANSGEPQPGWGRWLRLIEVLPRPDSEVVMVADDEEPVLVLSRAGQGRVALLASDQAWLWARGFEGGGPQLELLRRIAHWSMQEPELEEEALLADVAGGLTLRITRRSLSDSVAPVSVTGPNGTAAEVVLKPQSPGRFTGEWTAPEPGLYRLTQDDLTRVVALGPAAPREFEETVAKSDLVAPLAEATGGAVLRLADGIPALRTTRPGRPATGRGIGGDWIAITPRNAETVTGRTRTPLLPGWAWLAVIATLTLLGWLREGRRQATAPR